LGLRAAAGEGADGRTVAYGTAAARRRAQMEVRRYEGEVLGEGGTSTFDSSAGWKSTVCTES
jgi:hypothetical protein